MLQQTRVDTVRDYFPRFMKAFPTVRDLAAADEQEVFKLWEGLGYYRRASNLHKGARQVAALYGGRVPDTVDELLTISGIGPYTAGAIASIAYGKRAAAVDGNVIRVTTRLYGITGNVGQADIRRQIETTAQEAVPEDRPGDFNQALMDLGASICTPGTPDCTSCPLHALCRACADGNAENLPELPNKRPPRPMDYDVILAVSSGRVLMRCRTEAMLQGLWVYPMLEGHRVPEELPPAAARRLHLPFREVEPLGSARHVFSHQIWQMKLWSLPLPDGCEAPEGWRFVTLQEMEALPLPTAVKAAKEAAGKLLAK